MLSKVGKQILKDYTLKNQSSFGVRKLIHDFLYRDDKKDGFYQVAVLDPSVPLKIQGTVIENESEKVYQTTKLSNGVTVLTESASAPSRVDLGILMDVGTRDETSETSGSLLSIKNTYLKTVLNTNETVNYGIVQMSGGDFQMDYDQESTYYKANCQSHDVVDLFKMMTDCALEPRSVVAANVAYEKNQGTHKLEDIVKSGESFNEAIFKTAFGIQGLGMPLRGFRNNIGNLSAYTLQKFQTENINPNKLIVCASGVENHQEFVDLANETLNFLKPFQGEQKQREPTKYIGGEVRNLTDDNDIALALLFQSVPWQSDKLAVFQLLNTLLGGHGTNSQSRLYKNIINKNYYADIAQPINFNFSDSGLFGIKIQGAADQGTQLLNNVVQELKSLTQQISSQELNRAKAILKTNVFLALQRQSDRLEEAARNLRQFDAIKLDQYAQDIDAVTSEQLNEAVAVLVQSKPTLVVNGGQANRLPSFDEIQNSLKL